MRAQRGGKAKLSLGLAHATFTAHAALRPQARPGLAGTAASLASQSCRALLAKLPPPRGHVPKTETQKFTTQSTHNKSFCFAHLKTAAPSTTSPTGASSQLIGSTSIIYLSLVIPIGDILLHDSSSLWPASQISACVSVCDCVSVYASF